MNKFKPISIIAIICLLVGTIISSNFAIAQSTGYYNSASQITRQARPNFQTYYGSDINTYWPILGEENECEARQDIMLNVAPASCQPTVVRSDLLAEQNVPVFCQIDAVKINPLLDISQIRNINFRGDYPPGVVGSGFHPARAALRTNDKLLGSPLVNNIGYAVIVLKKEPDESKLPESINVTLSASIDYAAGNAYGIGRSEFLLEETTDTEWEKEKLKQSFWNGRYFLRLESVDSEYADVSIYQGDKKFTTVRVEKGQTSRSVFVPGMYCRAGLEVVYDGFVSAENKARIEVSSGNDLDTFDVTEGSSFLDNRCQIRTIEYSNNTGEGSIAGNCKGKEFYLKLKSKSTIENKNVIFIEGKEYEVKASGDNLIIDLTNLTENSRRFEYALDSQNNLYNVGTKESSKSIILINSSNNYDSGVKDEDKIWLKNLREILINYKNNTNKTQEISTKYSEETKGYYNNAIEAYEITSDDYSGESNGEYGKLALTKAIKLAKDFGKGDAAMSLIEKYVETYPNSQENSALLNELSYLEKIDSSESTETIQFDDKARTIKLLEISEPKEKSNAIFIIENKRIPIDLRDSTELTHAGELRGKIILDDVNPDEAIISAYCNITGTSNREIHSLTINTGTREICGLNVRLDSTNSQKIAKIRLNPKSEGTRSESNLTIGIGIEKRAIELTPDKTKDRIEIINKSIEKWEKISEGLGKVVTGLKGACFATSTFLTFKNFLGGLKGETLARQEVMGGDSGWRSKCKEMVGEKFTTMDACYLANADKIDSDVKARADAIQKVNQEIKAIQNNYKTDSGIFGDSVNTEEVKKKLIESLRVEYGNTEITDKSLRWVQDGKESNYTTMNQVLQNPEDFSMEDIRTLLLNKELLDSGSESQRENAKSRQIEVISRVNQNRIIDAELKKSEELKKSGLASPFYATPENQQMRVAEIRRAGSDVKQTYANFDNLTHTSTVVVPAHTNTEKETDFAPGTYILGLREGDAKKGIYTIDKVWLKNGTELEDIGKFTTTYGLGNLRSSDRVSYSNEIASSHQKCSYYETEPYRGMPAVIPFDYRNGWYAATKQTLPTFGGIGAFDSSGRVTSFWLCNVGDNKKVEFETGLGDDLCQQINLNTGQPLGSFPGLDEKEAKQKISEGIKAIQEAANQYGNKFITINGERCEVGPPSTGQPGTQCQDFMSPKDCLLMFNVCDPVICPTSRCNFGGQYPVADVAQTGIVGSALLCLPNIKEGIAIPVCLTGIQAGIDGFISIMKNHRDCLTENLETGQMVGLCDQIYSIYLCEFFWNQIAPVVNILLPKLIEMAYGQGVRGGGEYLTVTSAWQNMEKSLNYFTQSYAVNSIKAFQARSTEEVGGEFCKAFISAKAPTAFKTLLEPDSPPQFYAWFDAKQYSDVTVPATSQYKVFYHIFGGKDQGVHFNVYLKNPPESSYYMTSPYVQVDSGFIPRGEYASETKDFTAPEGYKELCVRINNEEKCGFGQVSTSFAVNYLSDSYVEDQIKNANIVSETECIGGTPNAGALLNTNIQQGVEEAISPEIYNRGIIRICSTQNPGLSTEPSRFVNVGYCDDQKIGCWLDKNSVDNAITDSNIGLVEETLEELDQQTKDYLEGSDEVLSREEANIEIRSLEEALAGLGSESVREDADSILNRISEIFNKILFNDQKAQILLVSGEVNEFVARHLKITDDEKTRENRKEQGETEQNQEKYIEVPKDNETEQIIQNIDEAIEIAKTRSGKYSINSGFVDSLHASGILNDEEYREINGEGWWDNLEGDMEQLLKMLESKKEFLETNKEGFDISLGEKTEPSWWMGSAKFTIKYIYNNNKQTRIYLHEEDSTIMVDGIDNQYHTVGEYGENGEVTINELANVNLNGRDNDKNIISGADYAVLAHIAKKKYTYAEINKDQKTVNSSNTINPPREYYTLKDITENLKEILVGGEPTGIYVNINSKTIYLGLPPSGEISGTWKEETQNELKITKNLDNIHLAKLNTKSFNELKDGKIERAL